MGGSSAISRMFSVPPLVIGMTIVAMGTSLPELSVSVVASLNNSNSLAVSNVVGSNLFNLMVVLGASALFSRVNVSNEVLKRDYPFSVICMILLLILGVVGGQLSQGDGILFLVVFAVFLAMMVRAAVAENRSGGEEESVEDMPVILSILFVVGGCVAIKLGGDWVVDGAVKIAQFFGVSETLIGLTIVACGTSLPELVTSLVAAKKGEQDMAIGNVIGSNIFNVLLILGTASAISPIDFVQENLIDIGVLLVFSLIVWLFCVTRKGIDRAEGVAMLAAYAGYLVYACIR